MKFKNLLVVCIPLILSGCISLDPDYQQPNQAVPTAFQSDTSVYPTLTNEKYQHLTWEEYIQNPKLKQVMGIAVKNNKDLQIALANIEAARAQYGITNSATLPTLNGSLNANKSRTLQGYSEGFEANVGFASYELDFFGKVKSSSRAALESFLATQESRKATELTIVSETAQAYYMIALNQSKLDIALNTLKDSKESVDIVQARVDSGVDAETSLAEAQTVYYRAESDVSKYKTQVAQSINALNKISGTIISSTLLPNNLDELQNGIKDNSISISSDILYNRPDILMAEHQLKSANANIGAARAAFFPSISLTTSKGIASSDLSSLFSGTHGIWSFAPSINIPIFNNGYNTANLNYSKAQKDKYIATYEQAIQTAFQEVSDVLARKGTIQAQINSFGSLVEKSKRSYELSKLTYESGITDYLSVLTAQRNLYSVQTEFLDLQKEQYDNLISFYKVTSN